MITLNALRAQKAAGHLTPPASPNLNPARHHSLPQNAGKRCLLLH
jgi:hypothetical protein